MEICNPSELHMHSLATGTFANVLEFSLVAASLLNKDQVPSLKPCCYVASYRNVPYTVLKAVLAQGFFIRFEQMTSCQINSYEQEGVSLCLERIKPMRDSPGCYRKAVLFDGGPKGAGVPL